MPHAPINLQDKFALFAERWSPRVVAEMNDYQFKLVRIAGEFVWHDHPDTDEVFIVVEGRMAIEFRDGRVELAAAEMFVVPRGVEHPAGRARGMQGHAGGATGRGEYRRRRRRLHGAERRLGVIVSACAARAGGSAAGGRA